LRWAKLQRPRAGADLWAAHAIRFFRVTSFSPAEKLSANKIPSVTAAAFVFDKRFSLTSA
jgi:hypothetical protein